MKSPSPKAGSGLVCAIARGRLMRQTLELFRQAGVEPVRDLQGSRELMCATTMPELSLVVVRSSDVPACVAHGGADFGITGSDVLLEKDHGELVCDPFGLGIGKCRLVVAAPDKTVLQQVRLRRLRIATKFVNTSRAHFAQRHGRQIQLVELGGSVEIAPALGMADAIVDLSDTGKTLEANNLCVLEKIADISARVIVNKASYKTRHAEMQPLLERLARLAPAAKAPAPSVLLALSG